MKFKNCCSFNICEGPYLSWGHKSKIQGMFFHTAISASPPTITLYNSFLPLTFWFWNHPKRRDRPLGSWRTHSRRAGMGHVKGQWFLNFHVLSTGNSIKREIHVNNESLDMQFKAHVLFCFILLQYATQDISLGHYLLWKLTFQVLPTDNNL